MILKKLYKWFTYKKRKERILHNIYKRIIKRYPNLPIYDIYTGRRVLNSYDLSTAYEKRYDATSGNEIVWSKYWILLLYDKDCNKPECVYKFRLNGKLCRVDEHRAGMVGINKVNLYTPDDNINEIFYRYRERCKKLNDRYKYPPERPTGGYIKEGDTKIPK